MKVNRDRILYLITCSVLVATITIYVSCSGSNNQTPEQRSISEADSLAATLDAGGDSLNKKMIELQFALDSLKN